MSRIIIIILVLAALLFPLTAAAANVPAAAASIGKQLDEQLMMRFDVPGSTSRGNNQNNVFVRAQLMIIGTTPANINNLQQASALARVMTEEVSRWLVARGYSYDEIRKGQNIRFDPKVGEFILTRQVPLLETTAANGQAILAGTYVVSGDDVRFNMSLICTTSNQVLAKASASVPITPDIRPMLVENYGGNSGMTPSVYTRLQ